MSSAAALIPMAAVLAAEVIDLADDRRCLNALLSAGFAPVDILTWLEDAQDKAREMRAMICDISVAKDND